MFPVGEDGQDRRNQRQRLVEGDVVVRGGNLHDRGTPAQQFIDVVLHVRRHEIAVLALEDGDPAVHFGEVVGDPLADQDVYMKQAISLSLRPHSRKSC